MDSFPLKLCRRRVMKHIHSSSNATVQVMEAGYFRTPGKSHTHQRPHHTDTTKESAFSWQMSTSQNSITFTVVIHCNNRNTVGLHFLQAFILWHVYRKNIYRIQKAYTSLSNNITYSTSDYVLISTSAGVHKLPSPCPNAIAGLTRM